MLDDSYYCEAVMTSANIEANKIWDSALMRKNAMAAMFAICHYRELYRYNAIMYCTHGGF